MPTVVRARGNVVTTSLKDGTLSYGPLDITSGVRLCKFKLKSTTTWIPTNDDYVEVTQPDGATLAFAGLTVMPEGLHRIGTNLEYDVLVQGWEAQLDRILITNTHSWAAGASDIDVLTTLLNTYYGAVGTGLTHVLYSARSSLPPWLITAGSISLRKALDDLARESNHVPYWIAPSKVVHWNDLFQSAPWVLSDTPNGSTIRQFKNLDRLKDSTPRAVRIRVLGQNVEYTATDWNAWAALNNKRGEEPGAPAERFPSLPDFEDLSITTVERAKQLAWSILTSLRTSYVATVTDVGLEPGMRVDIIDSQYGTDTVPYPYLDAELLLPSTTGKLDTGLGRFMVTRVAPKLLTNDNWQFEVSLGDPDPLMSSIFARPVG